MTNSDPLVFRSAGYEHVGPESIAGVAMTGNLVVHSDEQVEEEP